MIPARDDFSRNLKRVSLVHLGMLLAVMVVSTWQGCVSHRTPLLVPIEFMVEVPGDVIGPPDLVTEQILKPPDNPINQDPVVTDKPANKPFQKGRRIVRQGTVKKPTHNLTEEEIRRLLMEGAVAGDHTSIPDEDTRGLELVRRTLHQAWMEPAAEEVGRVGVEVEIELGSEGRILGGRILRSSGNAVMDESVMVAVKSVSAITGLKNSFIERHPRLTILFRVQQE